MVGARPHHTISRQRSAAERCPWIRVLVRPLLAGYARGDHVYLREMHRTCLRLPVRSGHRVMKTLSSHGSPYSGMSGSRRQPSSYVPSVALIISWEDLRMNIIVAAFRCRVWAADSMIPVAPASRDVVPDSCACHVQARDIRSLSWDGGWPDQPQHTACHALVPNIHPFAKSVHRDQAFEVTSHP